MGTNRIKGISIALLAVLCVFASCKKEPQLTLSKTEITFSTNGGTARFDVIADEDWTLNAPSWIQASPASGAGEGEAQTVQLRAEANTELKRDGIVSVTSAGKIAEIAVKQSGVDFAISQTDFAFDEEGTPVRATVYSEYDWSVSIPEDASWCRISPQSGSAGETQVTFTPTAFTDRNPRSRKLITFNYGASFVMVSVSQTMPNDPPSKPVLASPENGATDVNINADFRWQKAVDPDGDEVTYTLMASSDNGNSWITADMGSSVSGRFLNFLEKETPYLWKVTAKDSFNETSESDVWSFTTGAGGVAADGDVSVYQMESAGAPNPVHLVITGDGFIDEDYVTGGAFDQAVETAVNSFFGIEPFASYRNYFRISVVAAHSQERGATVLSDMSNCKAQTRTTCFSSTLEGGNSTGTSCDYEKVFAYARKAGLTDADLRKTTVIVLINLDVYAGTCMMEMTGRSVSMCPMGKNSFEAVVKHEAGGHGFGRLLDEYRYYGETLPSERRSNVEYWRNTDPYYAYNISFTNNREEVHWKQYFTLSGYESVGIYEGAMLYNYGVYRPEYVSCMEDNRPYYNAPSREAIVRRIMSGAGRTFNMDEFIANDNGRSSSGAPSLLSVPPAAFIPLGEPILVNK